MIYYQLTKQAERHPDHFLTWARRKGLMYTQCFTFGCDLRQGQLVTLGDSTIVRVAKAAGWITEA